MKRYLALVMAYVIVAALTFIALFCPEAIAEENEDNWTEAWVLCQPDSWVNSRRFPKKDGEINAYLFSGTKIFLDGKQKRGFVHAVGMNSEDGDGWVSKGFIVYSEPVEDGHRYPVRATGRVAARRAVGGTRRRWLHDGDEVTVYMISDEWCLTNEGFVKTEFIDLDSRLDIDTPASPEDMTWEADE